MYGRPDATNEQVLNSVRFTRIATYIPLVTIGKILDLLVVAEDAGDTLWLVEHVG
jgi:L-lysine 2,3-aminomutase